MKKALPEIRDKVTSNWPYKLVAVLVAVVLWLSILWGRKDNMLIREIPVEIMAPARFSVIDGYEKSVFVKLAGPRVLLRRMGPSTSPILLTVQGGEEGPHRLKIHEQLLNLPQGVRLLSAEPSEITVTLSLKSGSKTRAE